MCCSIIKAKFTRDGCKPIVSLRPGDLKPYCPRFGDIELALTAWKLY